MRYFLCNVRDDADDDGVRNALVLTKCTSTKKALGKPLVIEAAFKTSSCQLGPV